MQRGNQEVQGSCLRGLPVESPGREPEVAINQPSPSLIFRSVRARLGESTPPPNSPALRAYSGLPVVPLVLRQVPIITSEALIESSGDVPPEGDSS